MSGDRARSWPPARARRGSGARSTRASTRWRGPRARRRSCARRGTLGSPQTRTARGQAKTTPRGRSLLLVVLSVGCSHHIDLTRSLSRANRPGRRWSRLRLPSATGRNKLTAGPRRHDADLSRGRVLARARARVATARRRPSAFTPQRPRTTSPRKSHSPAVVRRGLNTELSRLTAPQVMLTMLHAVEDWLRNRYPRASVLRR